MRNLYITINYLQRIFEFYDSIQSTPVTIRGIEICNSLLNEITFTKLRELYLLVNALLSGLPVEYYKSHIQISEILRAIYLLSILHVKFSEEESSQLFVDLVSLFTWLSFTVSQNGLPGEAYNQVVIALNPFSDTYNQSEVTWEQNYWIVAIDILNITGAREILMFMLASYFYLSRLLAHNYQVSHDFYEQTVKWLKTGTEAQFEDIEYLCFYSGILAANRNQDRAFAVRDTLKRQYEIEKTRNPHFAFRIAETLARKFGKIVGEDVSIWADRALTYNINIPIQEQVTLKLTALLNKNDFDKKLVFKELINLLNDLNQRFLDKIQNINQRQRLSDIINMVVTSSVRNEEYNFAFKCAYYWKCYFQSIVEPKIDEIIIFVISNYYGDETLYLVWNKGNVKFLKYIHETTLRELLSAKNTFEGTWTILANDDEPLEYVENESLGINSQEYEKMIEEYFQINKFVSDITKILDKEKIRMFELSWTNSPMFSILARKMCYGNSILVSGKLGKQREIKKVLIWCNPDERISDALFESEAIQAILKAKQIDFKVYSQKECSKKFFLKEYINEEYDVIWLICHGIFNYDDPNHSVLEISPNEFVSVSELYQKVPMTDNRRLLVLNACESGSSAIRYDAMGFSGFGSTLATESQSVIGHLWPVSSVAAGVFGLLLIDALTRNMKWEDAINLSKVALSCDYREMINHFSLEPDIIQNTDLIKLFHRYQVTLNELYFWGSPILFE